jgi:serine/threonine protein kinase/formylglycine-generating enzyme required for sulfatase activity
MESPKLAYSHIDYLVSTAGVGHIGLSRSGAKEAVAARRIVGLDPYNRRTSRRRGAVPLALQIPGFVIHREIGSGGMAKVFLATQTSLDRQVALKVMSPALAADPTFAKRFQREARTIAGLTHPNIVAVYEVGLVQHMHFFAMQHLSGGDLAGRLRRGLSEPELVRIVMGVAKALGFAHSRGVVHRDVTPGNILFDSGDNPVLTDFGIARSQQGATRITHTGVSIGTSSYMSPEQARGGEVDARSDLYSLGALLFEALTGKPPYTGNDGFAVAYAHVFEPIPRLPAGLEHWQALIDKVMAKVADDRYANSDELIAAFAQVPVDAQRMLPFVPTGPIKVITPLPQAAPNPNPVSSAVPAVQPHVPTQRMQLPVRLPESAAVAVSRTAEIRAVPERRSMVPLMLGIVAVLLTGWGILAWSLSWFPFASRATPVIGQASQEQPAPEPPLANAGEVPTQTPEPDGTAVGSGGETVPVTLDPSATDALALDDTGLPFGLPITDGSDGVLDPTLALDADPAGPTAFVGPPSRSEFVLPIIAQARALLQRGALTLPPRGNALDVLRYALNVDPNNADARQGVLDVAAELEKRAIAAYERKELPAARDFLVSAEKTAAVVGAAEPVLDSYAERRKLWINERLSAAGPAEASWAVDVAARLYAEVQIFDPTNASAAAGAKRAAQIGRPGYRYRDTLKIGGEGPSMVVLAPGSVTLTDERAGRLQVKIDRGFAMAQKETTVAEFERYVQATGRAPTGRGCNDREGVRLFESRERTWKAPGFEQSASHPVTCLLYSEVDGYVRWLSEQTGRRYRLPSEPQWWLAAGTLGAADCKRSNLGDRSFGTELRGRKPLGCDDGFAATAPAGSFAASTSGLYDMGGNVREWTADCFARTVTGRAANAAPWTPAACTERLAVGTSWISGADEKLAIPRIGFGPKDIDNTVGFRVAMELP